MALSASLTPLAIALTQGANDAFVQGSVLTGLSGRQAYNLKAITFELTNITSISQFSAVDCQISIAVTRRSKAAMPLISDTDVIFKKMWAGSLTTSGAVYVPDAVFTYVFPLDMPLVEETIYAQLDSDGTATSVTAVARLEVELDTMSDIDRLNLIARSLT